MAWSNWTIRLWVPILFILISAVPGYGQDTLPAFSAVIRAGNKVQVSWTNLYGDKIRQLSIQRSRDSVRLFKTIISIPDPKVLKNGFVDSKQTDSNYYYRLYILLDSGRYVFSTPKRPSRYIPPPPAQKKQVEKTLLSKPVTSATLPAGIKPPRPELTEEEKKLQTPSAGIKPPRPELNEEEKSQDAPPVVTPSAPVTLPAPVPPPAPAPVLAPEKFLTVKRGDTVLFQVKETSLKKFRDSITLKTKDTLALVTRDTIYVKSFVPKDVFRLSTYVFVDKSGLVHIELIDPAKKKYLIRFFEEDKTPLFTVKDIRDHILLIDKANFSHAGWFLFELYADEKLVEKNRIYISKDF